MSTPSALAVLPVLTAASLTPLGMALWSYLSPAPPLSDVKKFEDLRSRNGWINAIYTLLMFVGLFLPLVPLVLFGNASGSGPNHAGLLVAGLMLGGSVIVPWIGVAIITLPQGAPRYFEFWRYYEQRYKIGLVGISVVYIPLAIIGIVSAFELYVRGL